MYEKKLQYFCEWIRFYSRRTLNTTKQLLLSALKPIHLPKTVLLFGGGGGGGVTKINPLCKADKES